MTTAAAVAVTIIRASMSIALVLISMHFAAILTSVGRQFVGWYSSVDIILAISVIVLICTIID